MINEHEDYYTYLHRPQNWHMIIESGIMLVNPYSWGILKYQMNLREHHPHTQLQSIHNNIPGKLITTILIPDLLQ